MAKTAQLIRLMDVRWCFQTVPDRDGRYKQFYVRASKADGKAVITFDLYGPEGDLEGLQPELLDAIKAAIEMVRGRVKAEELTEQGT